MSAGVTREVAGWAAQLSFDDVPARVHERGKAQILSVLAAIHAARHSEGARTAVRTAGGWGSGSECTVFCTGERFARFDAIFANAACSVAMDFDDYLFAGHTGHSAVCASLAYAERFGASGRDVLAAVAAANETGGRLGAALLFGPQNGQMWAYIHLLEGAIVAGRMLGLAAEEMTHAIGIAFAQPVYPLVPAFMGPDSKMLIPASTTVEGCRAAELAANGWTGSGVILEDRQGFLARFNRDNLGWMLSGLGDAWVSDSLTYKVVPGCAYIDTAVDAFEEIARAFEVDAGRRPVAEDVERIDVRCGTLTTGMEAFSQAYRSSDRLEPITVNFSVALSLGLILHAGRLAPEFLSHAYLDEHRVGIEAAAAKVAMEHDAELDGRTTEAGSSTVRQLLDRKTLEGFSFERYVMAFPAEVRVRTAAGKEYAASQDVPLGGAGRPWDETEPLVRDKFLECYAGDRARAAEALEAVRRLDEVDDVREVIGLLAP